MSVQLIIFISFMIFFHVRFHKGKQTIKDLKFFLI